MKRDVMEFERHLEDNLFQLYEELKTLCYKHSGYTHFVIYDSKKRDIHKAQIRDRIVHQIIFNYLEKIYEHIFIADSYSSRIGKGTHKALQTLKYFLKLEGVSAGGKHNKNICVLKCDIKKYFDNINHHLLSNILSNKIADNKILHIINDIIISFNIKDHIGIPLGNITSQIFANIYLNELDIFLKKTMRVRFYVRYNDDFIIVGKFKYLEGLLPKIRDFLNNRLLLTLPPEKTKIIKLNQGIDFLGFVILPKCILLRNKTKGKIFSRINNTNMISYLGILKHCRSFNLKNKIIDRFVSNYCPIC